MEAGGRQASQIQSIIVDHTIPHPSHVLSGQSSSWLDYIEKLILQFKCILLVNKNSLAFGELLRRCAIVVSDETGNVRLLNQVGTQYSHVLGPISISWMLLYTVDLPCS